MSRSVRTAYLKALLNTFFQELKIALLEALLYCIARASSISRVGNFSTCSFHGRLNQEKEGRKLKVIGPTVDYSFTLDDGWVSYVSSVRVSKDPRYVLDQYQIFQVARALDM